jgi:hypothetical protein
MLAPVPLLFGAAALLIVTSVLAMRRVIPTTTPRIPTIVLALVIAGVFLVAVIVRVA